MKSIRYSIHFPALVVAALILWLTKDVRFPYWVSNFNFYLFGMMGALHATCIVVSLRNRKPAHLVIALCFITLAAVWSAATPILGLWGSIVWYPITHFLPPGEFHQSFIFLTGSAIGSAGYWLLVRMFWLKSLRRTDCLRTVALCVAATLLSFATLEILPRSLDIGDPNILTAAWWFAFSISLYWSEMRGYANKSAPAMANVS